MMWSHVQCFLNIEWRLLLLVALPCLLGLCYFAYWILHLAYTAKVSWKYHIVWLHICSFLCRLPALMYMVVTRLVNDIMKYTTAVQTRYYFTWHAKKLTQSLNCLRQWYYLVTNYVQYCEWHDRKNMLIRISLFEFLLSTGVCNVCVYYNGVLQAGRYGPCFETEAPI